MDQFKPAAKKQFPRILIAPLDWGLGHTTRCIPIIDAFLNNSCSVYFAGNKAQAALVKSEFPNLPLILLEGYNVQISRKKPLVLLKIMARLPWLKKTIQTENRWLRKKVAEYKFDAVISDNRYGLHHPGIHTVFITHQLSIKTLFGKWADRIIQRWNYSYINKFRECWIPDERDLSLAGELSHPVHFPKIPVYYTGWLSRLKKMEIKSGREFILIALSGPEPQRSLLEKKLVSELNDYEGNVIFLRGLPGNESVLPSFNQVSFYNHLPANELNNLLLQSSFIICRSGYSSVMDIISLQKKSILIPTPGQTEQEYLGRYLHAKKLAYSVSQKNFSLKETLVAAEKFPYQFYQKKEDRLEKLVNDFVERLG
ncbi:MAG TPA: glycosyltransferase [Chitinophagaceae bacterium]|jgi:UDP-N-acetylglucosamine:LPS N-acetylglucosamine transferase